MNLVLFTGKVFELRSLANKESFDFGD